MLHSVYSVINIYVAYKATVHGYIRYKKGILAFKYGLLCRIRCMSIEIYTIRLVLGRFTGTYVRDKKERLIYNCRFRDKILHTAFNNILILHFNKYLITDTFACLLNRGAQRAVNTLKKYVKLAKKDYKEPYLLKIDIKKFFYSIDRILLVEYLKKYFKNKDKWMHTLLEQIILSFSNTPTGLPLGNCLSQLLANVYLNEFDQYLKRELHIKYYVRYADDIFIFTDGKEHSNYILEKAISYLKYKLHLEVHTKKSKVSNIDRMSGLGYIIVKGKLYPTSKNKRSLYRFANNGDIVRLASWYGLNKTTNCYGLIYHALLNTNIAFIDNRFMYKHSREYLELRHKYIGLVPSGITREWISNILNTNHNVDIYRIYKDSKLSKYIKYLNIIKNRIIREYNYNNDKTLEVLLYIEDYRYLSKESITFTINNLSNLARTVISIIVNRYNYYYIGNIDTSNLFKFGKLEDLILYLKRLDSIDRYIGNYYPNTNKILYRNKRCKYKAKDIRKKLRYKDRKKLIKRTRKIISFDFAHKL